MTGLPNPPGFGNTEWDESYWGSSLGMNGPRFVVGGPGHWKATPSTTLDRTINISAGEGSVAGGAVYDRTDGVGDSVRCDPNLTNSVRYDVVVARWNWVTRTRTFVVVKGTTSPPPLNNGPGTSDTGQVNRVVGALYDGALLLVPVQPGASIFPADSVVDLRVWFQGADLRTGGNYLTYADLSPGSTILLPSGRVEYTGVPNGVYQTRSNGRRWAWGDPRGYYWVCNNGSWSMAPGSQGAFTIYAGHSYLITSSFSVESRTADLRIVRMSMQVDGSPMSDARYGGILVEKEVRVTNALNADVTLTSTLYAGTTQVAYVATYLAVNGQVAMAHNFNSPTTVIVDLGVTAPELNGPGL